MKALQIFTEKQLQHSRKLTPDQVLAFLEDFRQLHANIPSPSKLISMKVPVDLLEAFKTKAAIHGTPYQTLIKKLMRDWLLQHVGEK